MEGFNAMGHPIPPDRKQAAYATAKAMGIDKPDDRMVLVSNMVQHLEADHPFESEKAALEYVDIVGAYRLMAVLLTTPPQ